jgi:hypothetical protein
MRVAAAKVLLAWFEGKAKLFEHLITIYRSGNTWQGLRRVIPSLRI